MATEAPQCKCRECAQPLKADYQPGYATIPGRWQVTCVTDGCALAGYTFGLQGYEVKDLSAYRKVEKVG